MRLESIQALRGIAALMVVLYHGVSFERIIIAENGFSETALLGGLFLNGFAGVDLFFVISGFIMVWITQAAAPGRATSADFLIARFLRIYPLWWIAAGIMIAYAFNAEALSTFVPGQNAEPPGDYSVSYILKSLFLIPQFDFPVLSVGWTLIHELYFYVVFAALLLLPRARLIWALLAWGTLIVAGSLTGLTKPTAENVLTLAIHPMTMEFIFGALAGLVVTSGIRWRSGIVSLCASLWLTIAFCVQGPTDAPTMLWGRVLMFGLPCTALVYGLATLDKNRRTAWLIPAAAGALVCALLFQLYGVGPESPAGDRIAAVILPSICGALTMAATLWLGWLGGLNFPDATRSAGRRLHRIFRAVVRTGDWSYSIYLLHLFVLGLLKWVFTSNAVVRLGAPGPADNLLFLACLMGGVLLAGWLGYRLVERPAFALTSALRRAAFHRRAIFA